MKNKILVFICTFVLCFSLLVIPSFAFDDNTVGEFVFKEDISFDEGYPSIGDFYFNCNGVLYWEIEVTSEPGTGGTAPMIIYRDNADNNEVIVYINGNWVDDSYRYLYFVGGGMEQMGNFYEFMNNNEYVSEPYGGWYYDIYDIIKTALFDDYEINGAQDMAITLVALALSIVCILMPALILFCVAKRILLSRYL